MSAHHSPWQRLVTITNLWQIISEETLSKVYTRQIKFCSNNVKDAKMVWLLILGKKLQAYCRTFLTFLLETFQSQNVKAMSSILFGNTVISNFALTQVYPDLSWIVSQELVMLFLRHSRVERHLRLASIFQYKQDATTFHFKTAS